MKVVGIRELKNQLSRYVRLARAGEVILVTDRGEVVAEITKPGTAASSQDIHPGLMALAEQGLVSLGERNRSDVYLTLPAALQPGSASRLLDEERDER